MPEFVVVTFPTRRGVFMDNQPIGHIGDPLIIQAGFHDFDLGSPADYTPATQNVNVVNTTAANPMIVPFLPVTAVVEEAVTVVVAQEVQWPRAKRKAKTAKKKAAKKTSREKTAKRAKIAPTKKAANKTATAKRARRRRQAAKKK